jgi:4-hydroxy-3-methylbut-2-en-1-yl diphosphate reductase
MEVIAITPRGYCKGVVRAIELVRHAVHDPAIPKPIYVFGMIVHNRHVVDELTRWGVKSLHVTASSWQTELDIINSGTVVVTAHGASPALKKAIVDRHLHFIDATCEDVLATQESIEQRQSQGYHVLYIGKRGHPETEGVLAIDSAIELIESIADIDKLPEYTQPLYVTNQTTLSLFDLRDIHHRLRSRFPDAILENELCDATRLRQEALLQANVNIDLCYIVGDSHSNNTQSLVRLSQVATNTRTKLIETVEDIDYRDLAEVNRVSVSSGASTPTTLTNAVIDALRSFAKTRK